MYLTSIVDTKSISQIWLYSQSVTYQVELTRDVGKHRCAFVVSLELRERTVIVILANTTFQASANFRGHARIIVMSARTIMQLNGIQDPGFT